MVWEIFHHAIAQIISKICPDLLSLFDIKIKAALISKMIIVIEHFQSLIAIKRYNLRTKLNESLVYRCLKGCKLCLCLLKVLSLYRDRQVSLLLNPLSALNNLLLNDVIVDTSIIIEAIVFLSNQNLVTEFIHIFVLIVDRNLIITVQRI